MIIYSVENRFFAIKADAEAFRKQRGLKPCDTHKIAINNREELAAFLDGLFQYVSPDAPKKQDAPAAAAYVPDIENAPSYIPEFVKKDWELRAKHSQKI